jgi:hypothetical protein
MRATLVLLALTWLLPSALWADKKETRKANPFAPSLRQLTDEEEEKIDRIIDQFIKYDTGRLPGKDGKKALTAFQLLGPDAIPGLIRGLNKAAQLEASCPALTIGKKLNRLLTASMDSKLLDFARENIGAGVERSSHQGLLRTLRVNCMVRKREVANALAYSRTGKEPKKGEKSPRTMSVAELTNAVHKAKDTRLRSLLSELARRKGDDVVSALHSVAATKDGAEAPFARNLLTSNLSRLDATALKKKLEDDRIEVRAAAARAAAKKGLAFGDKLISLLRDNSPVVRKAAHQALVKLSKGTDYGPKENASEGDREEVIKKWQAWLAKQKERAKN